MKVATFKVLSEKRGEYNFEIELFEHDAPITVANFEKLANSKFYDGLYFHRVIAGFVAQGGCPIGNGTGGPGYTIVDELIDNPNKHLQGSLSMANSGRPNSGGSQFFICFEPQPHLDGHHTVFGRVSHNMDEAMKIKRFDQMIEVRVVER